MGSSFNTRYSMSNGPIKEIYIYICMYVYTLIFYSEITSHLMFRYHRCIALVHWHTEVEKNRRHFADDIFKCIFLNVNVLISREIALKFVSYGPINNIPLLLKWWLGAVQATSHYLNQGWLRIYASLGLNELKSCFEYIWSSNSFSFAERSILLYKGGDMIW